MAAIKGSPRESDGTPVVQAAFATRRTARNRRWSPPPAWPAEEMPFRLDYSAEHGQRLDEGIGVPRLSGLSTRDRRTQKAYDSLDSPQTREPDFAVSRLWAESRGNPRVDRADGAGSAVLRVHHYGDR